ncbi:SpaH/EbpB family LPXTG-anchored major pilin [Pseudolactococcus raffinolactis]|uniref:SpaH/EbpB family LPXTG-anchored major pilin n=1 Tax=Pseudolactococcus raffinolactis TaxID=1366 RepID=UPI001109F7B0|nr:SpaH/EbpB family LPXTG-anchored major pilin [Lactococcus raffinolactis]TLQ12836.1 isopeptide-forming domain-containing fimbrial protein [Lactococcus raffinolactis]
MKPNKFLQVILATILLLTTAFVSNQHIVSADDNVDVKNTNITINKRIFDEGNTPANKQNTGDVMSDFGGQPLNSSEFTVYNVSDQYYSLIKGSDQNTAIARIQQDAASVAPDYAKKVEAKTTDVQGQATFANLPLTDSNGKYIVYLFVETKTPNNVTITKRAVPMVVAMPIYKLDAKLEPTNDINKDIQLYPKNETAKDTKEFSNLGQFNQVTVNDTTFANVTTGDTLNYKLTVNIPANIGDSNAVKSYKINDKPSAGLALVAGTVKVGSLVKNTDYTITEHDGGFTVDLKLDSAAVKALAGQKLQLAYNMTLTATVDPDALQSNKASVQINNDTEQQITPPTPVGTGGYKFTKKDAQTDKVLQNAKFVVTNKDQSKFATFTTNANGDNVFTKWVDAKDAATKVVSDANGSIRVIGLLNGDYVLNETDTPSANYVLLKDGTITFTVEHGKYGASNLDVKNTPKGLLPSTGGAGIYAFIIIGAAMIIGAYIWFKKSRQQAEV